MGEPDRYPTRLTHAIDPIPRHTPVVWGLPGDGPLDPDDLARFDADGYLIRPETIAPGTVAELTAELRRLAATLADDDPRVIREPGSADVRSIFAPHEVSAPVAALARAAGVLDAARQLLGGDVYLHQARINYMPGFTGRGFFWHSDFETWHAEDGLPDIRTVSCSLALTENYPHNGSLLVMPGTHHMFYPCVGATPDNHHRRSLSEQTIGIPDNETITKAVDSAGIEQFLGPSGTALWFDANLLHGSGSNITPFPRSNLFLVFNSVHNPPQAPYAAPRPRPEHIAARRVVALTPA